MALIAPTKPLLVQSIRPECDRKMEPLPQRDLLAPINAQGGHDDVYAFHAARYAIYNLRFRRQFHMIHPWQGYASRFNWKQSVWSWSAIELHSLGFCLTSYAILITFHVRVWEATANHCLWVEWRVFVGFWVEAWLKEIINTMLGAWFCDLLKITKKNEWYSPPSIDRAPLSIVDFTQTMHWISEKCG